MIKRLLVVFAAAAVISMACFTILGVTGGFPRNFGAPPWGPGWPGPWGAQGRAWRDGGPETSRDLPFTGASRIDIGYPAEITYTQGDQPRFTVTGPQYILDQLRLEGGDLTGPNGHDGPRFGWGRRLRGRLRIDIVSPHTDEFHLAGAQKLTLRSYDQDELRLYAAGAADVDGEGKARHLEAQISGAGHLQLEQLTVDDAFVSISGAGDATLNARNSAQVSISGAGHVEFKCRPAGGLSQHISGFGSVDEGPNCAAEPPASSTPAPAEPPAAAPKSKV